MNARPHHRRSPPQGRAVAGAVVVAGIAASVGLLLAIDAPDLRALAASAAASTASCFGWPMPSAAF